MPLVLAVIAVLSLVSRVDAWGFAAHREVNRAAVKGLPEPLAGFLGDNADYLAEHSIDPDLWRTAGREGENPNHFLDLDAFPAPPDTLLLGPESAHLARFGAEAARYGRLPWRVEEAYRDLVAAFRVGRPAPVLQAAAVLGHYLGDAHVPFHATRNYDGQLTGQTGLHRRWEAELFERFERQILEGVEITPARPGPGPLEATFGALRESLADVEGALLADRASAGPADYADTPEDDRYDDAYYSKLYGRERERIRGRFQAAAARVGSLWLSAWVEAGRPALERDLRLPYVRRGLKAVLLSLDGAPAPLIGDALARGVMPRLARLRGEGAFAAGSLTALPAKTPAGHAALFTGAWSDVNGIAGIEVPVAGASVVTAVSGYLSSPLRAEPIWVAAARQGLDVTVTSATQAFPFGPFLEERRFGGNYSRNLLLFDGYHTRRIAPQVYTAPDLHLRPPTGWSDALRVDLTGAREFELRVADVRLDGLLYDDPKDPAPGLDTMALATDKRSGTPVTLKPLPAGEDLEAFARVEIRSSDGPIGLFFRLFVLSPSGSDVLLYRAGAGVLRSNRPLAEAAALGATGGFTPNGALEVYRSGAFGPLVTDGGEGTAEARYLETVRLVVRQFQRLFDFGNERTRWDLLVAYCPFPDEVLHAWMGYLDAALPGHDPERARRLRPYLDEALGIIDEYVGHVRDSVDDRTAVAVVSDHGLVGVNREVRLNVTLQRAGLLTLDGAGNIDLSHTRAVYFPGNSGYFLVNRASRPGGIVAPGTEEAVVAELRAAILAIRDPDTGEAVVTRVFAPGGGGDEPGIGGPQGGDLYFEMLPGYQPAATLHGPVLGTVPPRGDHMLSPERREML
ncbi:MAG TPA: alkaline phosphatase family protein, partial [Vicinamibacteria bacterium]